ncbi:MAG: hypothetical protein ABIV25_08580 [Paracoccaceae bacterium]
MSPLEARLNDLAARGQTTTYGTLASDLGLTGPGTIAQLTAALEALMDRDAAANHSLRAALVSGRLNNNLPAQGFFDKAAALGRYDGSDPAAYITAERQALYKFICS